jgi:hypothetical protein
MFAPHEENQQASSFAEFNIKCASAISKKGEGFSGFIMTSVPVRIENRPLDCS